MSYTQSQSLYYYYYYYYTHNTQQTLLSLHTEDPEMVAI